jgi:hypothetical protein
MRLYALVSNAGQRTDFNLFKTLENQHQCRQFAPIRSGMDTTACRNQRMLPNGYTAPLPHLPAYGYGLSAPSSIESMAPPNWTHIFCYHHNVIMMYAF